jgi:hypothetical protein
MEFEPNQFNRLSIRENGRRTSIKELLLAQVGKLKPDIHDFAESSEALVQRLEPEPVVLMQDGVKERISDGQIMIIAWPHILATDVPLVYGTAGLNQRGSERVTRGVVSQNPKPLFPPGSFGVWFKWDDIGPNLKNELQENRFAARGNFWLNWVLSGGMFVSGETKSKRNSEMVGEAGDHLSQGGNVVIWPSGPDMIGPWHSGAARILLQAISKGQQPDVVYAHSSTFAGLVLHGLFAKAEAPAVLTYTKGPTTAEVLELYDRARMPLQIPNAALGFERFSKKVTPLLHWYLQEKFFDQSDMVLQQVEPVYRQRPDIYQRMKSFYDKFRPDCDSLDMALFKIGADQENRAIKTDLLQMVGK